MKKVIFAILIGLLLVGCEEEEKETKIVKEKVVVQEQVQQPQVVTQPVVVQQQDNFVRDMLLINALSNNSRTTEVRYVDRPATPTKNTTIIKNYNINKNTNVQKSTVVKKTNISKTKVNNIRPKTTVHKATYKPTTRTTRSIRVKAR